MHAKRSVVTKSWLNLLLAAGAVLALGCGPEAGVEEGQAPEERTVSAQSEYCPGSGGFCVVPSGTVFCGVGRPKANAFQTPDGGWCIAANACGPTRPICTPSDSEN
jgi:hypothetical protein